jgi:hypothetical protein
MVNLWNFIFEIFYIVSSLYILFIMMRVYARTRERELAWRIGAYSILGSLLFSPFITMIAVKAWGPPFGQIVINFSLILESVCVLPQLLLLRQTTVPTVIDSYYLVALGSYRALYIINWIDRFATDDHKPEGVAVLFGVLQTLLYIDFAWVYYTRQRVKLRGGGIVDSDDLNKSWVLRRVLGRRGRDGDDDDEEGRSSLGDAEVYGRDVPARTEGSRGRAGGWGRRGISVSADDDVLAAERGEGSPIAPDARMRDPDELAKILDDDESEGEASGAPKAVPISGGEEWRDRS